MYDHIIRTAKIEERTAESTQNVPNDELISKKAAIELVRDVCDAIMSGCESWYDPEIENEVYKYTREVDAILKCKKEVRIALRNMPSAQPELPSYVAEIEEEYQKAVKSPYIHKPLAKALYEVWKKHDRDDAERMVTDGGLD